MVEVKLFWSRLNSLIKERGETQQSVSVSCGLNPRRLQNLSAGLRFPDCYEAALIAEYLHTTVEYLVLGKEQEQVSKFKLLKSKIEEVLNSVI